MNINPYDIIMKREPRRADTRALFSLCSGQIRHAHLLGSSNVADFQSESTARDLRSEPQAHYRWHHDREQPDTSTGSARRSSAGHRFDPATPTLLEWSRTTLSRRSRRCSVELIVRSSARQIQRPLCFGAQSSSFNHAGTMLLGTSI
jgi:hypothetical protein